MVGHDPNSSASNPLRSIPKVAVDRLSAYAAVEQARFLTSRETGVYQFIADYLAEDRDQGRWTPMPSILDALRGVQPDVTIDDLRRYMGQMIAWRLVLPDQDSTGIRSLREIHVGRIRYQLTPEATLALRFRDQIRNPEGGSLTEQRPRSILQRLIQLQRWVDQHPVPNALSEEDLRTLTGMWAEISDTLGGMQNDADQFLGMVERQLQSLSGVLEVPDGHTHPLVLFRGWFEQYMTSFISEVQKLQTFGRSCLAQLRSDQYSQPDGTIRTGEEVLRDALVRAEGTKPDLALEAAVAEVAADRVITRIGVLVSDEGTCQVLIVRTHAALDRYLSAVKRIRVRMGVVAGASRARLFSALAAKVAHLGDEEALALASMLMPEHLGGHQLNLNRFPHARRGLDPWKGPIDWDLPLLPSRRGNPLLRRSNPVRPAGGATDKRAREHAAYERREAEFWDRFLASGRVDLEKLNLSQEEATWLTRKLASGMHNARRRFRLKNGRTVQLYWGEDLDAVSRIHVATAGTSLRPRVALEVVG